MRQSGVACGVEPVGLGTSLIRVRRQRQARDLPVELMAPHGGVRSAFTASLSMRENMDGVPNDLFQNYRSRQIAGPTQDVYVIRVTEGNVAGTRTLFPDRRGRPGYNRDIAVGRRKSGGEREAANASNQ